VLNAANEIAVGAFLRDEISFLGMSELIEETLCQVPNAVDLKIEDYVAYDSESRTVARNLALSKRF
jgi:1-deoxy-D-xylulose-5-phosphate reductoisomerase